MFATTVPAEDSSGESATNGVNGANPGTGIDYLDSLMGWASQAFTEQQGIPGQPQRWVYLDGHITALDMATGLLGNMLNSPTLLATLIEQLTARQVTLAASTAIPEPVFFGTEVTDRTGRTWVKREWGWDSNFTNCLSWAALTLRGPLVVRDAQVAS